MERAGAASLPRAVALVSSLYRELRITERLRDYASAELSAALDARRAGGAAAGGDGEIHSEGVGMNVRPVYSTGELTACFVSRRQYFARAATRVTRRREEAKGESAASNDQKLCTVSAIDPYAWADGWVSYSLPRTTCRYSSANRRRR